MINKMRKIKFRAYIKKQNKMVEITEISFRKGWFEYYNYEKEQYEDYYCTDTDEIINSKEIIIMQYTGFKDKNGKEIYDGDVFKCGQTLYKVFYAISGFKVEGYNDNYLYNSTLDCFVDITNIKKEVIDSIEVIGNIYENQLEENRK